MFSSFSKVSSALAQFGARRLALLAFTGILTVAATLLAAWYLTKPSRETLYVGLLPADVSRIGAALTEAGISFDANSEGSAVYVNVGETARARAILAEKGLPQSDRSGYELFDQMGSMGLTSFMQQVTRVRALEGELARSIQIMDGVRAARVHLVFPKETALGTQKSPPTASIVLRTDAGFDRSRAAAIANMVAAAVPGLQQSGVTILSTDGLVLYARNDPNSAGAEDMVQLETGFSHDVEARITQTLSPFLGIDNFRVSATARLNTDKSETSETVFDPESRVERSVRTTRESGEAQNAASGGGSVSVDQNIPQEVSSGGGGGDRASEKKDRREETTNFEINSKQTSTRREGYRVENVSVAVIVNKARLAALAGTNATPEASEGVLKEIQRIVAAAAGTDEKRGDRIEVTTADFLDTSTPLEPVAAEGMSTTLMRHLGTLINGLVLLGVAVVVILFGLKPAIRAIASAEPAPRAPAHISNSGQAALSAPNGGGESLLSAEFAEQILEPPQKRRLAQVVELDGDRAARVLKAWLNEAEAA